MITARIAEAVSQAEARVREEEAVASTRATELAVREAVEAAVSEAAKRSDDAVASMIGNLSEQLVSGAPEAVQQLVEVRCEEACAALHAQNRKLAQEVQALGRRVSQPSAEGSGAVVAAPGPADKAATTEGTGQRGGSVGSSWLESWWR